MSIGVRLKYIRTSMKLNQADFSRRIDVTQGNLSRYEQGKQEPSLATVEKALCVFGINAHWLLTGEGPMFQGEEPQLSQRLDNWTAEALPPQAPEEDNGFREALPDVYALYKEVQRLKAGQPGAAPPVPEIEELDEEAREAVAEFARFQLARQRERESKSPPKPAPALPPAAASSKAEEAHEPAPEYGTDEEWSNTPLLGQTAAGPPLDTQGWPNAWRKVRLRKREDPKICYLLKVTGTSMVDAGIPDRSLILVRRAEEGSDGQIVIAHEPQEGVTLKRLARDGERRVLQWQDGSRRFLEVTEHTRIQGVFIRVIDVAEMAGRAPA